jgi:hypothetical protein
VIGAVSVRPGGRVCQVALAREGREESPKDAGEDVDDAAKDVLLPPVRLTLTDASKPLDNPGEAAAARARPDRSR